MASEAATAAKPKGYKTYIAKPAEHKPKWYLVDATSQPLGRLAVPIALRLMGKDKPIFTPHLDLGDFVVVINAEKIGVHPRKLRGKEYRHWSGYLGGLKVRNLEQMLAKKPGWVLEQAVRRMLPKNLLAKQMLKKLKVYRGPEHPHAAQRPEVWQPLA